MSPSASDLQKIAQSNPPRRAKKARILPKGDEYDAATSDDDSEPSWTPSSPPVSKRGRKPGNTSLSRSAREAQRRENHSRIEKLRRTKINDALATLRKLVPPEYSSRLDNSTAESPMLSPHMNGMNKLPQQPPKEKEFKLEILVKTVSFVQDLMARNQDLEKQILDCTCAPSNPCIPSKRKADVVSRTDIPTSTLAKRHQQNVNGSSINATYSPANSLPSISEWLPESADSSFLPSPPSSTHFAPAPGSFIPPLSLGPSATPLSPTAGAGASTGPASSPRGSSSSGSGASLGSLNPPSPEEESAASVLLHIASRRSSSSVSLGESLANHQGNDTSPSTRRPRGSPQMQAHTPGSIMGIRL